MQGETGSATAPGSLFDPTAMTRDNPLRHHQPDPCVLCAFGAEKTLEKMLLCFGVYYQAIIANPGIRPPYVASRAATTISRPLGRVLVEGFDGVLNQVDPAALKAFRIDAKGPSRRWCNPQSVRPDTIPYRSGRRPSAAPEVDTFQSA